ncbi:MAG: NAD(P)/FAD-dependent oxidoreductase [Actinobacteria bacterium]|nr:NAD(P)/FAD-dependent oxidoreductase [Actinomycetota bacterium]MCG2819095.1 NAD(P)/FAD-dependent oxidoreductase [Actinomycetes bacterium]MBU4218702.1 NAD(P)/FAD-dependent oxidoreductase [Actinomycetota bacterium]MBU4359431.1 NAD(P)/FAD-dependent oxidoreductase [Actinomycetota bacterium]MBU4391302.1 NAD(P)/FAD-dependent oxidoreductase [Actinomycetota bacterium]
MAKRYDVIIVGAGPAGIFCALELIRKTDLKILIIDKGEGLDKRKCPAPSGPCRRCRPCANLCGWGGAGAFSDGKLMLSRDIGGWLADIVPATKLNKLIDRVDRTYLEFGAPEEVFGDNEEKVLEIARRAVKSDLKLLPSRVRHMGTEVCRTVIGAIHEEIDGRADILMNTSVERIKVTDGVVKGVDCDDGSSFSCTYLVLAPGRSGADWFSGVARELDLHLGNNMVDIGVRVEVPAVVMEPLTDELYEPKLVYYSRSSEDRVRTFCMNPAGEVTREYYEEVLTVNGHSYAEKKTENTNFALLVDKRFTEPFREPITYGKYIAWLANLLGDGILVQRLGDLLAGRRSDPKRIARSTVMPTLTDATPGDLSLVLPFRFLSDILEMLSALDTLVPGVFSRNTLLYGVEVKFYGSRLKVTGGLESEVRMMFGAGDGVGITRGLVQASASGVLVAESIIRRRSKDV